MSDRRKFIRTGALGAASLVACNSIAQRDDQESVFQEKIGGLIQKLPILVSTWNHGLPANDAGSKVLNNGGSALDAVEAGVRIPEGDPKSASVGYGGLPDRDGQVTLDACIMDHEYNCGSVMYLQNIKHPVSVARKVMENTPHVMLAGDGALKFALTEGFMKENLLTEKSKAAWKKWKLKSKYEPVVNIENHDTIGMLGIDQEGRLAGACTTSGLAFKMNGRVGDSPIIGAGLYVDGEAGAATATGLGEMIVKICGSFLIVELMRQGMNAQQACEEGVKRISKQVKDFDQHQVGFLALDRGGNHGAYAIQKGFNYALYKDGENKMVDSKHLITNKVK